MMNDSGIQDLGDKKRFSQYNFVGGLVAFFSTELNVQVTPSNVTIR
jgi:hypothetical protein